jgi:anti-anti-sigma regulatory factor
MNAQAFLNASRRRIIRTLARSLLGISALTSFTMLALLLQTRNTTIVILLGLLLLCAAGYAGTLALVNRAELWQVVLPMVSMLLIFSLAVIFLLPEIAIVAAALLLLVLGLAAMSSNRRVTAIVTAICVIFGGIIIALPPIPMVAAGLGAALTGIKVLGLVGILVAGWAIYDQLIMSQNAALDLADQRAAEAEAARADAEIARAEVERLQRAEQERLLDLVQTLELPVISLGAGVLAVPLVGSVDSRRAQAIQARLLDHVAHNRAHTVVLDVTGISVIDTAVAQELLTTAHAIRLLGARTIISGMSAAIAQTIVGLGIVLDDIETVRDLGQALERSRLLHKANR